MAPSVRETKQLIDSDRFEELRYWHKLTEREQEIVKGESQQLAQAMMIHGGSKLSMGYHFLRLKQVLEPKRCFQKHIKELTRFPLRTVLRYIASYQNAAERLPESIIKAAMARGMNILGESDERPLGVYTDAVQIMPPPRNPDAESAVRYLDQIEQFKKDRQVKLREKNAKGEKKHVDLMAKAGDPDELLFKSYRSVNVFFRRLPNNVRSRRAFVEKLVGMLLTDLGVANPQSFDPTAIPEGFKAVRGRPVEKKTGTESASVQ